MARLEPDPKRFFDPLDPTRPPQIVLERVFHGGESWVMTTPLGYHDRELGEITVEGGLETDLTSVPQLFTWLVPKTGVHLPAALLHDALTPPGDRPMTQIDSDRVFREAMADLGTPPVRRWLVWSAVSLAAVRTTGWVRSAIAYGSLVVVVVLGVLATLDLFDVWNVLPWMADRSWVAELGLGLVFALIVPAALSLMWPKRIRAAGLITGVALAALLHVTLAVALVSLSYRALELAVRSTGRR